MSTPAARPRGATTARAHVRSARDVPAPAARPRVRASRAAEPQATRPPVIPEGPPTLDISLGDRAVHLTNLQKPFWPRLGVTKGDLVRYYAAVAPWLLPHLKDRAMVMKRYPNGVDGPFFFMKRTPLQHPAWLELCPIEHGSGSVIAFPMAQDLPALLWLVNLGCIDLNPWYARCDDTQRPDWLHFDLDPVPGAGFDRVREAALIVRDALAAAGMLSFAKTTGSRGIHVYVPIVRGPAQKQVWTFAKAMATALAQAHPGLITSEYRVAKRPRGRVLVDYNQNAWGRTLASVYSVRPRPRPTVSTPVTWEEIERGVGIDDFDIHNVPARLLERGDLWKPLLAATGRIDLARYFEPAPEGPARMRARSPAPRPGAARMRAGSPAPRSGAAPRRRATEATPPERAKEATVSTAPGGPGPRAGHRPRRASRS